MADGNPRLILIDDEPDFLDVLEAMLDIKGIESRRAGNFDEAVALISQAEVSGNPFSAATIDMTYKSGIQQGYKIIQHFKQNFPYIACILISGSVEPDIVLDLRDTYGLDYFISKTRVDPEKLERVIEKAIKRVNNRQATLPTKHVTGSLNLPTVFISYRREVSWGQARSITNSLRQRGYNVFLDVDNINEGGWSRIIKENIHKASHFIPLLTPETLDHSPPVVAEIRYALDLEKKIVPIMLDNFDFYDATMPEGLEALPTKNALKITHDSYEADINKLVERFLK